MPQTSSLRNPDFIPAEANSYLKKTLMRDQVKRLRKSPDTSRMYSVSVPFLRATFYQESERKQKQVLKRLRQTYPEHKMILKQPLKK